MRAALVLALVLGSAGCEKPTIRHMQPNEWVTADEATCQIWLDEPLAQPLGNPGDTILQFSNVGVMCQQGEVERFAPRASRVEP